MIQEILDYLLIRNLLYNSDSEELIAVVETKENFVYILDNIYLLMQEENFVFLSPHLVMNVSAFIQKYRFDYNKEKEINDKMNYIIERLNDYRHMSSKRKELVIQDWILQESENRNLPLCYRNLTSVLGLISLDAFYFLNMVSIKEPFQIECLVEYLSIINIIINKFPQCFAEDIKFLEVTRQNLDSLAHNKNIPKVDARMVHRTLKKIRKTYSTLEEENFQKVIKKTQN